VEAAVDETVQVAIGEKVDVYIFEGDLTNPDSGSSVFRVMELALCAAMKLSANNIASYWMPGNHDVIEDGTGDTTLNPLKALTGPHARVRVMDRPSVSHYHTERIDLVFLPYVPIVRAYDPAEYMCGYFEERAPEERTVVIGHCTYIEGVIPGEETREMPRGRALPFPQHVLEQHERVIAINGHYHTRQTAGSQRSPIHLPGALQRLAFGEEKNEPGYLVVTV
jgi:DNA repair exonuclease SbcCD nuclease subunit